VTRRRPAVPDRQLAFPGLVLSDREDPHPLDLLEALGTEVLSPDTIRTPQDAR
jgi:hypothetical protein